MTPREFAVSGPVRIQATGRAGDLTVTTGAEDEVRVDIDGDGGDIRVDLVGDVLRIEVPQHARQLLAHRSSHRIAVTVPPRSSLDVGSGSGDVRTLGELAQVAVRTGSGRVDVAAADDASITAGSGDVTMTSLGTGTITTGSGDVVAATVSGALRARSASGDVVVTTATELDVTTASGDVLVRELHGQASARTVSGDILVNRAVSGRLQAMTASGDVAVRVAEGTAALLGCSSVSGTVTSTLEPAGEPEAGTPTVELRARTISGDISIRRTG